jgi:hypothetical protein
MSARCATLRPPLARGVAPLAVLAALAAVTPARAALGQGTGIRAEGGGAWVATPAQPRVGDTVWLEREIAAPRGWQVRAGKLDATAEVEPLDDGAVRPGPTGWLVRYAVVAWKPGPHTLRLPLIWRLGPNGRADSSAGGAASFRVTNVIPDSLKDPAPRGPLGPLRLAGRNPAPALAALLVSVGLLAGGIALRRRGPHAVAPPPSVPVDREVPDARWLAAGEPKAVATRATWRLRAALARAVPEAHVALATRECLAALDQARPGAPVRELGDLLEQLERVAFASSHGTDVAALATTARRLAAELTP